ncbi:MAG: ABC transporter ATP-binding protein [Hyphomicrobiaceae bacterium]
MTPAIATPTSPATNDADIAFRGVSKSYGEVIAVDDIDLDIPKGAFVSLLGPSGCGKTTSLRMMAGFEQPSAGQVLIEGRDVTGEPAFRRPLNMVFQHYALFPHLNIFDNVAYGLRQRRPRPGADEVNRRVGEALEQVRLSGYGERRTFEISGGQQQRVALARALVNRPKVLLLDEPLAALDRKLRRDMQIELQNLQRDVGITFVLVTHDQEEALSMSDLVCVMRDGRIVQQGSPTALYDEPATRYVADFVGKSNFLEATLVEAGGRPAARLSDGRTLVGRWPDGAKATAPGSAVAIAVRPELVTMSRPEPSSNHAPTLQIEATVRNRIFLGEHTEYLVHAQGLGDLLVLTPKRLEAQSGGFAPGETTIIGWPENAAVMLVNE